MRLLFCRHGNTFNSNQTPVLIGAGQDPGLTERGLEQARLLGGYLRKTGLTPRVVYCSELLRTGEFASEVIASLLPAQIELRKDPRLNELDYGTWSNRSADELGASAGEEWRQWERHSVWPKSAGFGASQDHIIGECLKFAAEVVLRAEDPVLCVSSNGRLRYFLALVAGELEQRTRTSTFKVGTGNLCFFEHHKEGFTLRFWNLHPIIS